MRKHLVRALAVLLATALGCGNGDPTPTPGSPTGGTGTTGGGTDPGATGGTAPSGTPVSISGKVVDYETGAAITSTPLVSTIGLMPVLKATISGSDYMLANVPPQSALFLFVSAPSHASTISAVAVANSDVMFDVKVVALTYVSALAGAFGVQPAQATAVLIARVVDAKGAPIAGVPAAALTLPGANGPYFFDASNKPATRATSTSASGLMVFFDVPPGAATLTAPAGSGWTLLAGAVPTAAGAVTLADVTAMSGSGGGTTPSTLSFATNVVPIFTKRGCVNCHSGGGPGKDLGGLQLDGGLNKVYSEITQETSPNLNTVRVNLAAPEKSALLTLPSYEDPPDVHPTATFASPADPDYQTILAWIKAGAKLN